MIGSNVLPFHFFAGYAAVLAVWPWFGNRSKYHLQLQTDNQATLECPANFLQKIKLEFNCVFAELRGHLSSKLHVVRSLSKINCSRIFPYLSSSTVWQIAITSTKMTSNRLRATVSQHSSVDWHSICIPIRPFSRTLQSPRLKSTGNCTIIKSKLCSS